MENQETQIIMGKGISAATLVNFLADLFLRESELYQATMKTLQGIIKEAMEEARNGKTTH